MAPLLDQNRVELALRAVRMQTLQCCAQQLATKVQRQPLPAAAADSAPPGAGRAGQQRVGDPPSVVEGMFCCICTELVANLAAAFVTSALSAQLSGSPLLRAYAGELSAALRDSALLEHCARCLLLQLPPAPQPLPRNVKLLTKSFITGFTELVNVLDSAHGSPTSAAALREALTGPCVRHAVLALGVAALCAADGGPSYGMPAHLSVPVLGVVGDKVADLRPLRGHQELYFLLPHALLGAVGLAREAGALPCRAALAIALRAGRLAVASARSWAAVDTAAAAAGASSRQQPAAATGSNSAAAAVAGPSASPPPLQVVLPLADAGRVGLWALAEACGAMGGRRRRDWPQRVQYEVVQLAADAAGLDQSYGTFRLGKSYDSCGPSLPPAVATAVGDCLATCLERQLRSIARTPNPKAWGHVVDTLLGYKGCLSSVFKHGTLRAVAPLARTLCKVVQLEVAGGLPQQGIAHAVAWRTAAKTRMFSTAAAEAFAVLLRDGTRDAQRALLAAHVAPYWLSALLPCVRTAVGDTEGLASSAPLLVAFLRWCTALLRTSLVAGRDAAAAACPSTSAGAGPPGAGGWLRLLPSEADVVQALGSALCAWPKLPAQSTYAGRSVDVRQELADCCCCVAAVWPAAVLGDAAPPPGPPPTGAAALSSQARALPWPPAQLRDLGTELRGQGGECPAALLGRLDALAAQLEAHAAGGEVDVAALRRLAGPGVAEESGSLAGPLQLAAAPSQEEACLLRCCAYAGCTELAGDSEAAVPLQSCGRCGAVGYCSRVCQVAHWRAGHKAECGGGATGAGAVQGGALGTGACVH